MARTRSFKFDNDSKKFFVNGKEVSDGTSDSPISANLATTAQANITTVGTLSSLSVIGNITTGNVSGTFLTGTLTTSSQPNITSVGTLGSLTVTGNVSAANLTSTFGVWGTLRTAAQTNITSVGTLTSLSVSGTCSITSTATVNSTNQATAIANGGTNGAGNIGASGASFNTVFARASSAQYADLAEIYRGDKDYIPGTVVVFGGTKEITVSLTSHDPTVAGVVSTNPAYLMNDSVEGVAVALQGRVPCRVLGPVDKGDRVVTSDVRGVAERLDLTKYQPGCVIGKSLESVPDGEIATIEVVVGRV